VAEALEVDGLGVEAGREEVAEGGRERNGVGLALKLDTLLGVLCGGGPGKDKIRDGAGARVEAAEAAVAHGCLADLEGVGGEIIGAEEGRKKGSDEVVGCLGQGPVPLLPLVGVVPERGRVEDLIAQEVGKLLDGALVEEAKSCLEVRDLGVELGGIDGGLADGLGKKILGKVCVADGCAEEADAVHDFDALAVGVDGVVVEHGLDGLDDMARVLLAHGGEGKLAAAGQHDACLERVDVEAEGLGEALKLLEKEEQIRKGDACRVVVDKGEEVGDATEAMISGGRALWYTTSERNWRSSLMALMLSLAKSMKASALSVMTPLADPLGLFCRVLAILPGMW